MIFLDRKRDPVFELKTSKSSLCKREPMEVGTDGSWDNRVQKIFAFPRYIKKSSSAWWQNLHGKWKKKDPGINGHLGVPETAGLAQRSALLFYTYFAAQRRKFENGGCENSKSLKGSGRSGRWSARVPASHLRDFATARERNRTPWGLGLRHNGMAALPEPG